MPPHEEPSDEQLIEAIDAAHRRVGEAQRELLRLVAEADRRELWRGTGARDAAHWLAMRQDVSQWKARRWIAAGHALETLPDLSSALETGRLGVDKVTELTRVATYENEAGLLSWARSVSTSAVRRRADHDSRRTLHDDLEIERARFLQWWYADEGRRFGMEAELPAAQGAIVARALERLAGSLPPMPGEEDAAFAEARRADALVAVCSARIARDADPDRATLVVHATVDELARTDGVATIEGGATVHAETARRLACTARVQAVIEDERGEPVRLGRLSREPSEAMMRQLRYRDGECRFPGCGAQRFTQAHHVVWWGDGGRTDLDNLVLVCSFHHRLVHEHGWHLRRREGGEVTWYRPDGERYLAGPAPPTALAG